MDVRNRGIYTAAPTSTFIPSASVKAFEALDTVSDFLEESPSRASKRPRTDGRSAAEAASPPDLDDLLSFLGSKLLLLRLNQLRFPLHPAPL